MDVKVKSGFTVRAICLLYIRLMVDITFQIFVSFSPEDRGRQHSCDKCASLFAALALALINVPTDYYCNQSDPRI